MVSRLTFFCFCFVVFLASHYIPYSTRMFYSWATHKGTRNWFVGWDQAGFLRAGRVCQARLAALPSKQIAWPIRLANTKLFTSHTTTARSGTALALGAIIASAALQRGVGRDGHGGTARTGRKKVATARPRKGQAGGRCRMQRDAQGVEQAYMHGAQPTSVHCRSETRAPTRAGCG